MESLSQANTFGADQIARAVVRERGFGSNFLGNVDQRLESYQYRLQDHVGLV